MASLCPAPFLSPDDFTSEKGYIPGRSCGTLLNTTCCLPCPYSQWVFTDSFMATQDAVRWTSPASLAACAFLLISWALVPTRFSHRHYLSVGLVVCVTFIALALVVPLGTSKEKMSGRICADAITPGDHRSDSMCAWTGSLFLLGGLGVVVWIFLRVIWLHICVVWDRTPGCTFIYLSIATGIMIPLAFLGATFAASGFSYSLGPTCFINHEHSFAVFWGWFAGFACASLVLQLATTGYCVTVYIMSHRLRAASDVTVSSWGSVKRENKEEVLRNGRKERWRGIRRILVLQWRIIVLAVALVIEGLYFCSLGWASEARGNVQDDPRALEFGQCLIMSGGDRSKCWEPAQYLLVDKNATLTSLAVMSLAGVQAALILFHLSLFKGWAHIIRHPNLIFAHEGKRNSARFSSGSYAAAAAAMLTSRGPQFTEPFLPTSSTQIPRSSTEPLPFHLGRDPLATDSKPSSRRASAVVGRRPSSAGRRPSSAGGSGLRKPSEVLVPPLLHKSGMELTISAPIPLATPQEPLGNWIPRRTSVAGIPSPARPPRPDVALMLDDKDRETGIAPMSPLKGLGNGKGSNGSTGRARAPSPWANQNKQSMDLGRAERGGLGLHPVGMDDFLMARGKAKEKAKDEDILVEKKDEES